MTSNLIARFYLRLLELDTNQDPESQIEEALRLLVQATDANAAYFELFDEQHEPQFSRSLGFAEDELPAIQVAIGAGSIAQALAEGRTFDSSATAHSLPRTAANAGSSIVCAPIQRNAAVGLVYLQSAKPRFTNTDIENAKVFARRIAAVASVIVPPLRTLEERITEFKRQVIRQELRRNDWNMTTTARSLGVGRAALYRALRQK